MLGWDVLIVFGFPFLIAALAFAYAGFNRYLRHRERMAMIERGIVPPDVDPDGDDEPGRRSDGTTSPVTITLIGVAITLGLLTLGPGPWLIGGLVPTAYGCALLIRELREGRNERKDREE